MKIDILKLISLEYNFIQSIQEEVQNKEYYGYLVTTNTNTYRIRIAKQTPKKIGQFVAIYEKENHMNIPYSYDSFPDFLVVYCFSEDRIGKFIFPKDVLREHSIVSHSLTKGKMAFRVYPLWDQVTSKQATQTKQWQSTYFHVLQM